MLSDFEKNTRWYKREMNKIKQKTKGKDDKILQENMEAAIRKKAKELMEKKKHRFFNNLAMQVHLKVLDDQELGFCDRVYNYIKNNPNKDMNKVINKLIVDLAKE